MKKETNLQNIVIVMLAVAIVAMSVGFALYTQTLNIEGQATFSKSKWEVHFDTATFTETSAIKATEKELSDTLITYKVTLPKPGTTYSFKVNVKNFGTINAALTKLTMSTLDEDEANYISYKVSYNGTEYTATNDQLSVALNSNESHEVIVTVSYLLPQDPSVLPTEQDHTVALTVALDYDDTEFTA